MIKIREIFSYPVEQFTVHVIPRIASIFEKATLREVRTITIRKKILYEFDIVIEKVDKFDIAEPNYTATK